MLKEVFKPSLYLGEGPIWDDRLNVLYFVDILEKKLFCYKNTSQLTQAFVFDEYISCVALHDDPEILLIALESGIYSFNLITQAKKFIIQPEKNKGYRYNDGRVHPDGNWIIGSMNNINNGANATHQPDSRLYAVNNKVSKTLLDNVTISNGLAFNDGQIYYIDSIKNNIRSFRFDGTFLTDEKILLETEQGVSPDGMTLSASGKLYIALWGGAKVLVFDLKQSAVIDEILMPCPNPTSCTFGGENMDTLFITTASMGKDKSAGIYAIQVADQGRHENKISWNVR